jgi:hypothetical protein
MRQMRGGAAYMPNSYMQWARESADSGPGRPEPRYTSMRQMRGDTDRDREQRQSKQQQSFRRALRDVARDTFERRFCTARIDKRIKHQ